MGGRRVALITIAALGAVVAARGARAQPNNPPPRDDIVDIESDGGATSPATARRDPKLAKKWLAAALQLMQKGNYLAANHRHDDAKTQFENAITAYQRAIEAGDDIALHVDLAGAEEKVGKLADAVKHLRRVVAAPAGVRPEIVRRATARLEDLSSKVGFVIVTVSPAGAAVALGGSEIGTAPLPEPLVLMPGSYTLAFQAEGFQPKEVEIKVEPGAEIDRAIELEPVNVNVNVNVEPVPSVPADKLLFDEVPARRSALPLELGAGVTGAGVLAAGVFGILALRQHATFTGATTSKLDREDARANGQRFALIADISLGTALVAAGFTVSWYFVRSRQHPRKSEDRHSPPVAAKLGVAPWVQPQSGGAMIAGWF